MVQLVVFKDEKEAATVKELLEANNIKVEISFFPTWTYLGGARPEAQGKGMIYVEEKDVKKATAVLEKHDGKEVKMERMPIPIESPEDKLAGEIRRLRIIASYKNHFWPGVALIAAGEVVVAKAFWGISEEAYKYLLSFLGFIFILIGILCLVSSKEGRKAEKELQEKLRRA
jgi:hypothetical protein